MREIKFRGLEVLTGDWVFGSHVLTGTGSHYILPQNLVANYIPQYHVDGDTVGQYTSLKDKNGKKIFEGDIVIHEDLSIGCAIDLNVTGVVRMVDGAWVVGNEKNGEFLFTETGTNEVVGNIYENPELLEDRDGGLLKCYESGTL